LDGLRTLLVFVPVLGSFLAHAPVMRYDWMPGLKRPLDFGATVRGRRVFGDNKTWRGALAMGGGVVALTLLLSAWPAFWTRLPAALQAAGPATTGTFIALGTVLGELPGSFVKRQLDIAPGAQRRSVLGALLSIWDQGDFVPGILLALLPLWSPPLRDAVLAFAVVAGVHLGVSAIGYAIGARKTIL
jgi:CDP-2,3-bis-(O-geranylgeranyl)-sn-glycerol synthase